MRYLADHNSRLVPANSKSVAAAVQELKALQISPEFIRNDIVSILNFERRAFVDAVNLIIAVHFGVPHLVLDFSVFKRAIHYMSNDQWKNMLSG